MVQVKQALNQQRGYSMSQLFSSLSLTLLGILCYFVISCLQLILSSNIAKYMDIEYDI